MQCYYKKQELTIWQFVIIKKTLASIFQASIPLLTANFNMMTLFFKVVCGSTWLSPHGPTSCYFDNVMIKFMINSRADPWKTDVNLLNHTLSLTQCIKKLRKYWSDSYLHISIFNAIMHHLYKMSSTISTNLNIRYWNKK